RRPRRRRSRAWAAHRLQVGRQRARGPRRRDAGSRRRCSARRDMTRNGDGSRRGAASGRPTPFAHDALALPSSRSPLRAAITAAYRRPEPEAVPPLLAEARLQPATAAAAQALARRPAQTLRDRKGAAAREGLVQGLLQEYSLSSQEGVALMCLAEALLRIPDPATPDALIRDKIS